MAYVRPGSNQNTNINISGGYVRPQLKQPPIAEPTPEPIQTTIPEPTPEPIQKIIRENVPLQQEPQKNWFQKSLDVGGRALRPFNLLNIVPQLPAALIDNDPNTTAGSAIKNVLQASNPFGEGNEQGEKGFSTLYKAGLERAVGDNDAVWNFNSFADLTDKNKQVFLNQAQKELSTKQIDDNRPLWQKGLKDVLFPKTQQNTFTDEEAQQLAENKFDTAKNSMNQAFDATGLFLDVAVPVEGAISGIGKLLPKTSKAAKTIENGANVSKIPSDMGAAEKLIKAPDVPDIVEAAKPIETPLLTAAEKVIPKSNDITKPVYELQKNYVKNNIKFHENIIAKNRAEIEELLTKKPARYEAKVKDLEIQISKNEKLIKDMNLQLFAEPEFKVSENGPVVNSATIKDGTGKSLKQSLDGIEDVVAQIKSDLEGADIKPDSDIQKIAGTLKDKSGLSLNLKDVYRNFKDVFGTNFHIVKERLLDPLDESKKQYMQMQKAYLDSLETNIVKKLGIEKNSKLSKAVQEFGEGKRLAYVPDPQTGKKVKQLVNYTLTDLQKEFPTKWKDIVEADKWFRKSYNELIDQINISRAKIYPNNPDKLIPKRTDYYRHFKDMSDSFAGVKNLFETPAQIDPSLAGISAFTKPKSKWQSIFQQRGQGDYKADAVEGFLDYIKAASYATHIDPNITRFRGLARDLVEATEETRNANNFIKYLQDFANDLAGKTNKYDRILQEDIPGGRATIRVINWINSRVKLNTVLGNLSSSLSQLANIPQGIAYVKNPAHLGKGFGQMVASFLGKGKAPELYKQSGFLMERYADKLYSKFDTRWLEQPKKFAAWMLEATDEIGTKFIWNSVYNKAAAEGIKNPIKHADEVTRSLVAGRGVGEMALLQKSKLFQLVAPFQVEVANLWHVQKDFINNKDFGGLAMLYLANYLFNKGMEGIKGSGVAFDPIKALEDAFKEKDTSPLQKAGRLGGEVLSNMPLGSNLAGAIMPEDARKKYLGKEDPTRFGNGLVAVKGLQDPLYKILPPFFGNQAKKTIEGLKTVANKGDYQTNTKGEKELRYPVKQTAENYIKGAAFGKSALPETVRYYGESLRPLSPQQTKIVERAKDPTMIYDRLMTDRKVETLSRKLDEIRKDRNIPLSKKQTEISKIQIEINQLKRSKK